MYEKRPLQVVVGCLLSSGSSMEQAHWKVQPAAAEEKAPGAHSQDQGLHFYWACAFANCSSMETAILGHEFPARKTGQQD